MRVFNRAEKQAFNQHHPKQGITGFKVVQMGKTLYQNASPKLCHAYIKKNGLKGAEVKAI